MIKPRIRPRAYYAIAIVVVIVNADNAINSISFGNPDPVMPIWNIIWQSFAGIVLYIMARMAIANFTNGGDE